MTTTRRAVTTAAAWAIPVVSVGLAAPLAAASGIVVSPPRPGRGCKYPGKSQRVDWGYRLPLVITSPSGGVFHVVSVSAPGDPDAVVLSGDQPFGSGESEVEVIIGASNSANGTATITWADLASGQTGTVTVSWTGFNPCKK